MKVTLFKIDSLWKEVLLLFSLLILIALAIIVSLCTWIQSNEIYIDIALIMQLSECIGELLDAYS